MNKNSISGCTYFFLYIFFFFTGNLNACQNHPPTQIQTLFGFVNPYGKVDVPLLDWKLKQYLVCFGNQKLKMS